MSVVCRVLQQCSFNEGFCIKTGLPTIISVRWRKPRHLPTAPSKLYRVREPTPLDPEEDEEMKFLYNKYMTDMRAIRTYCISYKDATKEEKVDAKVTLRLEIDKMLKFNKVWNDEVGVQREKRQEEFAEKGEELKRLLEERKLGRKLDMIQEAEERLAYEKTMPFITLENLDAEIEKALSEEKDYNFAIDVEDGRIIKKISGTN
ncbi:hypothetical protein KUTeg_004936 [Tegillarca granosa]|uniref:Small ribosomal subunit protein mS26 n=1 Tax=Tegillarca granosa TaxID=220873 RepID=A0ABQ9FIA6_TEGGR|nr:hypothetical protein KUTeg_004936 [Tegillarca granosa]